MARCGYNWRDTADTWENLQKAMRKKEDAEDEAYFKCFPDRREPPPDKTDEARYTRFFKSRR